jgi:hypothetical protein
LRERVEVAIGIGGVMTSEEGGILISGVRERDIDLLFLEEFVSSVDFARWFWRQAGGGESDVVEVVNPRRAVAHSLGESDLQVALLDAEGSLHCLLIENKVAANMQPAQAERYRQRGEKLLSSGEYADVTTVLVAPEAYLGPEGELHGFDARVSYESIREWFDSQCDLGPRRTYKTLLLTSAIEKSVLGYQLIEDQAVTDFWRSYWHTANRVAPLLQMREPGQKPASAGFVHFRPPGFPKDVGVVHKLMFGFVDLQFAGMGERVAELLGRYGGQLGEGMRIVRASKSGGVRLEVPKLRTTEAFSGQEADVERGMLAAKRLVEWFLEVSSDGR